MTMVSRILALLLLAAERSSASLGSYATRSLQTNNCTTSDTEIVPLNQLIPIEVVVDCPAVGGVTIDEVDLEILTQAFLDTYNDVLQFCDPFFRTIDNATVTPVGEHRDGNLVTVAIELVGTCQGCDPTTDGFYDTSNTTSTRHKRQLGWRDNLGLPTEFREFDDGIALSTTISSANCTCDELVVGRAPYESEWIAGVESELAPFIASSLTCITSLSACTADLVTEFTTQIALFVEEGQDLSTDQVSRLGDALQAAYNSLMDSSLFLCEPSYRVISLLQGTAAVGDPSGFPPVLYDVVGNCENCEPGSDLLDVVSERAVLRGIRQELADSDISSERITGIEEYNMQNCSSPLETFSQVVIVELIADCPFNVSFAPAFEAAYVSTYNELITGSFCDPLGRSLQAASIVTIGALTTYGTVSVEVQVNGTCRNCDPDSVSVYDPPTMEMVTRRNRKLSPWLQNHRRALDVQGSCLCTAQPVGERGATEAEFVTSFMEVIEGLGDRCIGSVRECQETTFESNVIITLGGNLTELTNNTVDVVEESVTSLLEQFYGANGDVCNPEEREILQVNSTLEFTFNGDVVGSSSTVRRILGGHELHRTTAQLNLARRAQVNDTDIPSGSPTTAPVTDSPTTSPTSLLVIDFVRVLLTYSGTCRGCPNELLFFDQVSGRRELQANPEDWFERAMQQTSVATSDCFCPLNATITAPTTDDVQVAVDQSLDDANINLNVEGVTEAIAVPCDEVSNTRDFTSKLTFRFSAFVNVPEREVEELGELIGDVYNEIMLEYCDPLVRRNIVLTLQGPPARVSTGRRLQVGCVNFEATFDVEASCRGCEDETSIFDEESRRLLSQSQHNPLGYDNRRLQDSEICFCDFDTVAPRAPTYGEFIEEFEPRLLGTNFDSICGLEVVCESANLLDTFSDTVIWAVQLSGGASLGDAELVQMEQRFMTRYNQIQEAETADKCGGSFRRLTSVTLSREALNGFQQDRLLVGEDDDEELADRQLQTGSGKILSLIFTLVGGCPILCEDTTAQDLAAQQAMVVDFEDFQFIGSVIAVDIEELITDTPSSYPSEYPSEFPSAFPSSDPSQSPSLAPSTAPSSAPSESPTLTPVSQFRVLLEGQSCVDATRLNAECAEPPSDGCTPQANAVFWLAEQDPLMLSPKVEEDSADGIQVLERYALATIGFALDINDDPRSWFTSASQCDWADVTCNGSNRVSRFVPGTTVTFQGSLPREMNCLEQLVDLRFQGQGVNQLFFFPGPGNEITLENLNTLFISETTLAQFTPFENLKGVNRLWLPNNQLSSDSLLEEIADIADEMTQLVLSGNLLRGNIPESINQMDTLEVLWLNDNVFSGTIPVAIGDLDKLQLLDLEGNILTGVIPAQQLDNLPLQLCSLDDNCLLGSSTECSEADQFMDVRCAAPTSSPITPPPSATASPAPS